MTKKEYIDTAKTYIKMISDETREAYKANQIKYWYQTPALKMWTMRIAMIILMGGMFRYEFLPGILKSLGI